MTSDWVNQHQAALWIPFPPLHWMISMAAQQGLTAPTPGQLPSVPVFKTCVELPHSGIRQSATHLKPVQAAICPEGEILWLLKWVDVAIFDKQVPQVQCL